MDTKRLLTSLLVVGAVMLAYTYFTRGGGGAAGPAAGPKPAWIFTPFVQNFQVREPGATADPIVLGDPSKTSSDNISVKIDPATAGVDLVQLNVKNFAETYKRIDPLTLTLLAPLPEQAKPFSTMGVHISIGGKEMQFPFIGYPANPTDDQIYKANRTAIFDTQYLWKAGPKHETPTDADVDLTMTINDAASKPVARIIKNFHLDKINYQLTVKHTIENLIPAHTLHKSAADKVIDLGEKNVVGVVVKVGDTVKTAGADYTVDAAAGAISIVPNGGIKPADALDIAFHLPGDAISVRIDQFGPTELNRSDPQTDDRFFHGMNLDSAANLVDADHGFNLTHLELRKATATGGTAPVGGTDGQFNDYAKNPQLWIAAANRFFTIVVRPDQETISYPAAAPAPLPRHTLKGGSESIETPHHVATANIDLMTVGTQPSDDVAIVRIMGNAVEIPPGAAAAEPLSVYLGPKDRAILAGDLRAPEGSQKYDFAVYQYLKLIQFQQGCYSYCISDKVVTPILSVLDFLKTYVAFGNYGIAIMILVIAVRALLHPLTRASQVNMAKMGKQMRDVQPKLEAMKKKYADDKKKQSEEMMRIYKENNINPAGGILGCLPMFIQMPIWAALYSGLRNDIDLRHAPFIPGWINDLASPDSVFPHTLPIIGHPLFRVPLLGDIYSFNLLPILLAAVFFIQMKVSTATQPAPTDEQQAQMQKMSKYMIFIFPLFLYNAPSGLNLYIFASTMAGLLDTYLVRKTLKKRGILPASAQALPTHEQK